MIRGEGPAVPTGELDDTATILALLDTNPWDTPPMPACEGSCGGVFVAERAHFDADKARFVALCSECEPIPFTLAEGV